VAQLFSLGSKRVGDIAELACAAMVLVIRFGCRFDWFKLRRGFEVLSGWFSSAHAVRLRW